MTPFEIRMCLGFYYAGDPLDHLAQELRSPVGRDTYRWMLHEGLITPDNKPTERLFDYVKRLKAVRLG